jgi:hypothetical protein
LDNLNQLLQQETKRLATMGSFVSAAEDPVLILREIETLKMENEGF